ncbi:hypothetical protein Syun_000818 [Stephania yunnanensis]|uniref:Myosin motor domain-containing protein n=1 Tax=Stephania yunnanensis TaxID=152371 RepID=A0AAP0LDT2_9MAGN
MPKGIVLPANPNILEDIDDLIQLSFLNEPSVLHNLCCIYSKNKSYTKARPILLAMNPFKGAEILGNEIVSGCEKKPEFLLIRVIQLAKGERSFHMFYQLYSGVPSSLKGCILFIDNRDGINSVSKIVDADSIRNGNVISFLIRDGLETK